MADPRFFSNRGPIPLGKLAGICGATLSGGADPARLIRDVAPLDAAGADDLSFLDNSRYLPAFRATRAGACLVAAKFVRHAPAGTALLVSEQPYRGYALAAQALYPPPPVQAGVHARALVEATARLGLGCEVGPGAVIGAGAEIGARCRIGANSVVGSNVVLGNDCLIGANVTLSHCRIGERVTLHPGVRIGQDGFGFAPDPSGHLKVPQLGRVLIGDDCEIGANTTIDRGAGPDTVIGNGTWIDNLVQIGHNVQIGRCCIIVAQVGIAGSARLGDFVAVGGQAGVGGHLSIGSGVQISAQAGVITNLRPGDKVGGSPAVPVREFLRQAGIIRRLGKQKGDSE
ncbi:MAG TPA: UDP-3-O-(3-hydroxymyristoyl)glucosamine N-acyltransferase [Candidatus Sulfotelmatobacter sp.]|nr:UDP-3-O-(3-hydroxymyristoyl)glucosamine N-acyltransferase [Candidatus Sulfotelmatobacter sp.]